MTGDDVFLFCQKRLTGMSRQEHIAEMTQDKNAETEDHMPVFSV